MPAHVDVVLVLEVRELGEPFQRNTGCSPFARGIFEANGGNRFASGDDSWVGAAIYLPRGFWEAHGEYSDLIRVDSYVTDEGRSTTSEERQYITFAAFSDDRLYMRAVADRPSVINELVRALPSSELPEGQWNWVEMHIRLSQTNGSATSELKINGVSKGTSTLATEFSGKAPLNRVRYGLVSSGANGDNIDLYVDRAAIERVELGPARGYEATVLGTNGLVSYWRLGEAAGTTAADEQQRHVRQQPDARRDQPPHERRGHCRRLRRANLRIYKNGRQVASRAQTGAMTHGTNTLYVGFNDFSSTYFSGTVDEVAIYSRGLAAEEALAHYTAGTS